MGCCISDALPDIPDVLIPDPDANDTIKAVVRRIGWARDFSVHKDVYPSSSEEVKQKMWMWINKSDGGVVDLENFVRGWNEQQPTKGKVFYSAIVTERPHFEQFQRAASSGYRDRFMGFFGQSTAGNSGYDSDDDNYYINHQTHRSKFGGGTRHQGQPHHNMITKWRLNTRAVIRDGNLGRGADTLQGKDVILEVFSKGTAATGWEEVESRHTDEEGREHVTKRDEKRETEWVDRVEFRLSVAGAMWAEWVVQGDTHYNPGAAASIECPLFHTDIEGGWFSKSLYTTTTRAGVDPALALLVAHLCYTEYSVAEIKGDLRPNTPASPPRSFQYNAPTQQMMFQGAAMAGQFQWGKAPLPSGNYNGGSNNHNNGGYNNGGGMNNGGYNNQNNGGYNNQNNGGYNNQNNGGYNNGGGMNNGGYNNQNNGGYDNQNNGGYNNQNNGGYSNQNNGGYNNQNNGGYSNQPQHPAPTTVNLGGGFTMTIGGNDQHNGGNHGGNNHNGNNHNGNDHNGNNGNHGSNKGKGKGKKNRGNGGGDGSSSDSSSDESDGGGGRRRKIKIGGRKKKHG